MILSFFKKRIYVVNKREIYVVKEKDICSKREGTNSSSL